MLESIKFLIFFSKFNLNLLLIFIIIKNRENNKNKNKIKNCLSIVSIELNERIEWSNPETIFIMLDLSVHVKILHLYGKENRIYIYF